MAKQTSPNHKWSHLNFRIDEDGSGLLEFGEFCQLAARFLVEEDEEALKKELKEAFRIYDKEGKLAMQMATDKNNNKVRHKPARCTKCFFEICLQRPRNTVITLPQGNLHTKQVLPRFPYFFRQWIYFH